MSVFNWIDISFFDRITKTDSHCEIVSTLNPANRMMNLIDMIHKHLHCICYRKTFLYIKNITKMNKNELKLDKWTKKTEVLEFYRYDGDDELPFIGQIRIFDVWQFSSNNFISIVSV